MNIYSLTNLPPGFYTYAYLRSDGSVYYIGKGKGARAWRRGKKERIKRPRSSCMIVIMECNLTEVGALALERRYISWYGRIDLGTGCLRNMTDGGDGTSGPKSEEFKQKISKPKSNTANYKKPKTKEHALNISEARKKLKYKHSDETRIKMSDNHADVSGKNNPNYGKPRSEETKQKIRETLAKTLELKRLSNGNTEV